MTNWDFTLAKYELLCRTIIESDYTILPVHEFIAERPSISKVVVMRHDVDRKVADTLKMAQLENHIGICSTYYFRKIKTVFKPDIIKKVSDLGHEIGYHYEVLSKTRGDYEKAILLFEQEFSEFRKICEMKTICMHSRPLLKWDNRDLWKKYDFQKYGIIGEAYLSVDYSNTAYLTDSGRNWNSKRYKLRDEVDSPVTPEINSTDDLISLIRRGDIKTIALTVHPNRWSEGMLEWGLSFFSDLVINEGKMLIKLFRKGRMNG